MTVSSSALNPTHLPFNEPNSPATDEKDWLNDYPISMKYRDMFDDIITKWRATPLPAFDASGKFIKVGDLEDSLRGSLVLVYFELKHYTIKDQRSTGIASNTFTAIASCMWHCRGAEGETPSES